MDIFDDGKRIGIDVGDDLFQFGSLLGLHHNHKHFSQGTIVAVVCVGNVKSTVELANN